jgi:hypothetical protein
MFPSDRMAQLDPQALGTLFVAFYDSQSYDGGTLNPPPHGRRILYPPIRESVNAKHDGYIIHRIEDVKAKLPCACILNVSPHFLKKYMDADTVEIINIRFLVAIFH